MPLNSAEFLLLYLPAVWGLFWLACGRAPGLAVAILPMASAAYCLFNDPRTLPLLLGSLVGTYLLVQAIRKFQPRKGYQTVLVGLGITLNLLPLAYYKYSSSADLAIFHAATNGAGTQPTPMGLAFFALQQITFLIDGTKAQTAKLGFVRYLAWGSLFPQLAAGPIAPYGAMVSQYQGLGLTKPQINGVLCGLSLMLMGFLKNLFIAAPLDGLTVPLYRSVEYGLLSWGDAIVAAWGFMLQLYINFSAFSDMAIGVALCFGIRLPANFNSPFKSKSMGDYVTRWHMSLAAFVRDYIFLSVFRLLQRLFKVKRYLLLWIVALQISFVFMGLWHSLSWMMVFITSSASLTLVIAQAWRASELGRRWAVRRSPIMAIIGQAFSWLFIITLASVMAGIYRAETLDGGMMLIDSLLAGPMSGIESLLNPLKVGAILLPISAIVFFAPNSMEIFGILRNPAKKEGRLLSALRWRVHWTWGLVTGAGFAFYLVYSLTAQGRDLDFLYGRF